MNPQLPSTTLHNTCPPARVGFQGLLLGAVKPPTSSLFTLLLWLQRFVGSKQNILYIHF